MGMSQNSLTVAIRLEWMPLCGKMYHSCNIGIESPLPVHGAVVLQWSFFAPKIITKIGGCGAKFSHGYDPGAVVPA